jgi:hypothetical protein
MIHQTNLVTDTRNAALDVKRDDVQWIHEEGI